MNFSIVAQDTLSTSILETNIVCKFNSRVTSYNERSASLGVFFSKNWIENFLETLVFITRVMRYLHPCFMILALLRVASFIAGTLLSLVNRCEPSSYSSPSWVMNITMLFVHAKKLSQISIMLFVLGSCLFNFMEVGFLGNAFIRSRYRYRYYFVYGFLVGLL